MDQQPNTTPSVRLPQPSFDPTAAQPAVPQLSPTPMVAPQMQPQPVQSVPIAQPQPIAPPGPAESATAPGETTPGDAQDEAWVAKAKDVAIQYKNDPFAQSNALSKLRADYLYKQHGITTKLGGEK